VGHLFHELEAVHGLNAFRAPYLDVRPILFLDDYWTTAIFDITNFSSWPRRVVDARILSIDQGLIGTGHHRVLKKSAFGLP